MLRTLTGAALVVTLLSIGAAAQNASSVVAAASKAMGVDTLNSITYSGTARNGACGQSKAIGAPLAPVNTTLIDPTTSGGAASIGLRCVPPTCAVGAT